MEKWNFPNCLVALEGKQVVQAPFITGSYFYNKNSHSVVLMALVNANYNFTSVDVGSNGRVSDIGIFRECSLQRSIEAKFLRVPSPKSFSGRFTRVHYYVIIGDEASILRNTTVPYETKGKEFLITGYQEHTGS